MRCPFCSSLDTKVTDSRDTDDGASIRRRRQCLSCNRRFTTYETVEQAPLRVVKKNGSREMFDRNKLRNGLVRACEKRNISSRQIEEIVNFVDGLDKIIQEKGYETAFQMAINKIHDFPTCENLIYSVVMYLTGALILYNVSESEPYQEVFEAFYEQLSHSQNRNKRNVY